MYSDYEAKVYLNNLYDVLEEEETLRMFNNLDSKISRDEKNIKSLQTQVTNNFNEFK